MKNFLFESVADSMRPLTQYLMSQGEKVSPRGIPTREERNVTITIKNPADCLAVGINRKMNVNLAVFEALQLIGGFSDPEKLVRIAPNMRQFLNDYGKFDGAYGPRVGWQMQTVIDRLNADPDSRQGMVMVWDPLKDLREGSKDYPCTISFNFAIRNGELLMSTHMRSNDVWWGWTYDAVQFTQLQWSVALMLGLEAGPYTHYVDSFHMYERDFDAANELTLPDYSKPGPPLLQGIYGGGTTWITTRLLAKEIAYDRVRPYTPLDPTEEYMRLRMRDA